MKQNTNNRSWKSVQYRIYWVLMLILVGINFATNKVIQTNVADTVQPIQIAEWTDPIDD